MPTKNNLKLLRERLKGYLEYCQDHNGREDCKNCGLSLDDFKLLDEVEDTPKQGWSGKELPLIEDKIQQVFKFLEIADIGDFHGKNVFEAGDADTLHSILETAFSQVREEAIQEERTRLREKAVGMKESHNGHQIGYSSDKIPPAEIMVQANEYLTERGKIIHEILDDIISLLEE